MSAGRGKKARQQRAPIVNVLDDHRAVRLTHGPRGDDASTARHFGRHNGRRNRQHRAWRESERRHSVRHCLGDDGLCAAFVKAPNAESTVHIHKIHAGTLASRALGPRATSRPRPARPVNSPSRMTTSPRLTVATG